ncbi:steroid receptor RNA activator 1 [Pogona vitticeps]
MAELYIKPGNRQRGWNDPPQFSYGLQQCQTPRDGAAKRGALARRVAAAAAPGDDPATPPPPSSQPPPPVQLPAFPPHTGDLPPPPGLPAPFLGTNATKPPISEAEVDCSVEDVLSPLSEALDHCRKSVQKQVCDDISKRLVILQQMWTQGKLSAPVRKRMQILTQELKTKHWDAADEIHRSLMVDHITEVSQWMVGVKRLIAETKNLPTEDLADEQKIENCLEPVHQED